MRLELSTEEDKLAGTFAPTEDSTPVLLRSKSVSEFVDSLDEHTQTNIGLLPPAVRWMSADKRIVVFERPPTTKLISYVPIERDGIVPETYKYENSFMIPIPWQVYVVYFDQSFVPITVRMFFRSSMLSDIHDELYLAPILNFYYDSKLCNPLYGTYEAHEASVSAGVNAAYNMVWNSGFNYDLKDAVSSSIENEIPFRKLKTAKEVKEQNIKENNAYSNHDNIARFFSTWADHTVYDVIDFKWPIPHTTSRGERYMNPPSLDQVLKMVLKESSGYDKGGANHVNEFIVTLVNIMSS